MMATVKGIVTLPEPARSPFTATHATGEAIDHVQSRAAVTLSCPVPPPAANCSGDADAPTWHLLLEGAVAEVVVEVQAESVLVSAATASRVAS